MVMLKHPKTNSDVKGYEIDQATAKKTMQDLVRNGVPVCHSLCMICVTYANYSYYNRISQHDDMSTGNKIKSLLNPLYHIHFGNLQLLNLTAHNHLCILHPHPRKIMHPLYDLVPLLLLLLLLLVTMVS